MSLDARHRRQNMRITYIALVLDKIPARLGRAYSAIALTLPDGYPTGGGERVGGGGTSKPTEGAYAAIEAMIESRLVPVVDENDRPVYGPDGEQLTEAIPSGLGAIDAELRKIEHAIAVITRECDRMVQPLIRVSAPARTNMVDCQACERPVAQTPDDRIRKGYCHTCYTAWVRAGQPDRVQFERQRKASADGQAPVVVVRQDDDPVTPAGVELTVAGVAVTLPPHLVEELQGLESDTAEVRRIHAAAVEWHNTPGSDRSE